MDKRFLFMNPSHADEYRHGRGNDYLMLNGKKKPNVMLRPGL